MKRRSLELKIASPCNADWDQMRGDDAIRFCGECNKNVYHLSNMTNEQVETLLSRAEDTPCVRFYERQDGSVLLGDCPVGSKRTSRRVAAVAVGAAMASMVAAAGVAMIPGGSSSKQPPPKPVMGGAVSIVQGELAEPPPPPPKVKKHPRMGKVSIRPLMGKPLPPKPNKKP